MSKILTVYTLYGDKRDISTVISRLVENDFKFHFTGEYLYDSTPWDSFLETYCQDIKDNLTCYTEQWSERCIVDSYQGTETDEEFNLYESPEDEDPFCKVYTYPLYVSKFRAILKKQEIHFTEYPKA